MPDMKKFLDDTGLAKVVGKLCTVATQDSAGMLPQLPGDENQVLLGNGTWGDYHGGGGSAGPIWLEVDDQGDLYAYYDDAIGEPTILKYEPEDGNLYAIFETEAA